ncbi:MAG TPA: amidohydrolase family protein, partial [Chloroflexota bacterium]
RLTLQQVVRATSEGPARTWGLYPRKGALQIGSDADFTLVDLAAEGVIQAAGLHGKNNMTPFEGRPTHGAAVATVVRGQVVMQDGALVGPPSGRMVSRDQASGRLTQSRASTWDRGRKPFEQP